MEGEISMENSQSPRKTPRKKHRRAKSNLESKQDKLGSSDPLITEENPRVLKARLQTKARFEALLQDTEAGSVADEIKPEETVKKRKKKKRTRSAEGVLESIRTKSPLSKELSHSSENLLGSEDERNNEKENINNEISASVGETRVTPKKHRHRSRAAENEETPVTGEKPRRRRKKQAEQDKSGIDETDQGQVGQENEGYQPETEQGQPEVAVQDQAEQTLAEGVETSKRRDKKGKRKVALTVPAAERISRALEKKRHDDGTVLSVRIHKTDRLQPDLNISHPMVRVHVIDLVTGRYLQKSSRGRKVSSYYHDDDERILPVMTQPFDFRKERSIIPQWEEVLIFNEIFSYLLKREETDPNVIMFFEVLDFLSTNATVRSRAYRSAKNKHEMGWHKIAWGFLKLVGSNGAPNVDKMVRLQLFEPPQNVHASAPEGPPDVYLWWTHRKRTPYPSTLYVTLKGVTPPENIDPSTRSMFAIQAERGKVTFKEIQESAEKRQHSMGDERKGEPMTWTRLPGQVNRIPNKELLSLPSKRMGCFIVKFSNDGLSLACACADKSDNPILIYEIPSGTCQGQFSGHFSLVYDIDWSPDNKLLLSASSDGTARAWDSDGMSTSMVKVFPHPCFVYTAKFHPTALYLVITGGYDRLLRVWSTVSEGVNALLLKEMDGHSGFINSICCDYQGQSVFSGDSEGAILMWNVYINPQATSKKKKRGLGGTVNDWMIVKTIKDMELKETTINCLVLHPSGRKLLVHCRDSVVRMLDLRSFSILHRYYGNTNPKEHIRSTVSSCGSFVFSGSEDGKVYIWNTENATLVSVYKELGFQGSVVDVDFHPQDNIIAFCSYSSNEPVIVYQYDVKVAREEAEKLKLPSSPIKAPPSPVAKQTSVNLYTTAGSYEPVRTTPIKDTMRMKRLQETLNSVMTPGQASTTGGYMSTSGQLNNAMISTAAGFSPGPMSTRSYYTPGAGMNTVSTWGSDFSATNQLQTPELKAPISPHAKQHLGSSGYFQMAQVNYGPQAGAMDSPLRMSQLRSQRHSNEPDRVVVMFPYDASRADELTIQPGDVIQVVRRESANWWFGQLANGQQGYFPSNYITEPEEPEEELKETTISKSATSGTQMSAVIGESGDLKIISGPEESETDILKSIAREKRRKHKERKSKEKSPRSKAKEEQP